MSEKPQASELEMYDFLRQGTVNRIIDLHEEIMQDPQRVFSTLTDVPRAVEPLTRNPDITTQGVRLNAVDYEGGVVPLCDIFLGRHAVADCIIEVVTGGEVIGGFVDYDEETYLPPDDEETIPDQGVTTYVIIKKGIEEAVEVVRYSGDIATDTESGMVMQYARAALRAPQSDGLKLSQEEARRLFGANIKLASVEELEDLIEKILDFTVSFTDQNTSR